MVHHKQGRPGLQEASWTPLNQCRHRQNVWHSEGCPHRRYGTAPQCDHGSWPDEFDRRLKELLAAGAIVLRRDPRAISDDGRVSEARTEPTGLPCVNQSGIGPRACTNLRSLLAPPRRLSRTPAAAGSRRLSALTCAENPYSGTPPALLDRTSAVPKPLEKCIVSHHRGRLAPRRPGWRSSWRRISILSALGDTAQKRGHQRF
jgi:hypothetical protein